MRYAPSGRWPGGHCFSTVKRTNKDHFNDQHDRYSADMRTFIVERDRPTGDRCGFAGLRLDDDRAICEDVFPATLGGQALVSN